MYVLNVFITNVTSTSLFFVLTLVVAVLLLSINLALAPRNPYTEKKLSFECGFTSFSGQSRAQFNISFFVFALLFLLFDLEILLVYPYLVSSYNNEIYGLFTLILFLLLLTVGFAFEIGKKALTIESKQNKQRVKSYKNVGVIGLLPVSDIASEKVLQKNLVHIQKEDTYKGFNIVSYKFDLNNFTLIS